MKKYSQQLALLFLSGVLYIAGQYFWGKWFINFPSISICRPYDAYGETFCNSPYIDTLGFPLITTGTYLALTGFILLFTNSAGLRRWRRFSYVYVPLAFFLSLKIQARFLGSPLFDFSYENLAEIFGKLYVLITLGIVIFSHFKKGTPKNVEAPEVLL